MRRAVIVLALLLLAGCGAQPSPAAKPKPSPSGDPHDYARALVETTASLRERYRTWQSNCDQGIEVACAIGALTISTVADSLTIELKGWANQSPPTRMLPLVGGDAGRLLVETTEDALKFAEVTRYYSDGQCNEAGPIEKMTADCITMSGDLERGWSRLNADLTSWEKYR